MSISEPTISTASRFLTKEELPTDNLYILIRCHLTPEVVEGLAWDALWHTINGGTMESLRDAITEIVRKALRRAS